MGSTGNKKGFFTKENCLLNFVELVGQPQHKITNSEKYISWKIKHERKNSRWNKTVTNIYCI